MELYKLLKNKKTGNIHCPICLKEIKIKEEEGIKVYHCKKCKKYYPVPEKDKDLEKMRSLMLELITKRYKPSFRTRVSWFFESFINYLIILTMIIFNPITVIFGGLMAIIILLITALV